ncbi:MAG: hypothetical protein HUU37_07270 [Bdellovibrionales bacterium]|nr:hypothetical protein [Bdellovibrionales bacterium]
MRSLVIAICVLAAGPAHAADRGKKDLSDADLMKAAASELEVSSPAVDGGGLPSGATVVTDISSLEHDSQAFPSAEFSLGAVSHRPVGTGRISQTETYPLDRLSARPMMVAKVDRWFREASRKSRSVRWGAEFQLGAGWNDLVLHTTRGVTYDDVRLYSVLASVGPVVELVIPVWEGAGVGAVPSFGRQFLVQSTAAPVANGTLQGNFWQGAVYGKMLFTRSLFARLEHQRRGVIGSPDGLGIQRSGTLATMGFLF